MKFFSMNAKAWGGRIMSAAIVAAWIAIVMALGVMFFDSQKPKPVEPKPVSLNCGSCLELSSKAIVIDGVLNLYLYSTMQTHDVLMMKKDIFLVESLSDIRTIRLNIYSGGGSGFTALAFPDIITGAQERGWSVEAYATGIIASAAVPVFSVCYPRYATVGTMFMVHPIQGRALDPVMADNMTRQYITYLVLNTKVSREQWEKMLKDTTWFTAEQAMEWGLVDVIQ